MAKLRIYLSCICYFYIASNLTINSKSQQIGLDFKAPVVSMDAILYAEMKGF